MATTTRWKLALTAVLLCLSAWASVTGMLDWYRYRRMPSIQEAFPSGEMVVAIDASFPPFAVDLGGEIIGIDADLTHALGDVMGIPVRFVTIGYDGLYDALLTGQADAIISALLINPYRTRDVRYTRAYFDNGLLLVTNSGTNIHQMADVPNHRLALEYGSTAESEARYWLQRLNPFAIMPYEIPPYALDAVRLGLADATLVDTTSYYLYLRDHPDWQSESNRVTNVFYAVAVDIHRRATWRWIENGLAQLQGDGRLDAIIAHGFSGSSN